jgi:glutamate dehydrogenase (NAD(P)+)
VYFGTREACSIGEDMKKYGLSTGIAGKRVSVQGLGNVGYYSAKFFQEAGAILVGVAEIDCAVLNPKGLDLEDVMKWKNENGTLLTYPKGKVVKNPGAAIEVDCDILIPAALENQITEENAPRIKARIIAEGANGPCTPGAEEILLKKNVLIIPDMFLNAGGVTVSYFEWLKNLSHVHFGRMNKRFQENTQKVFVQQLEKLTGKSVDARERSWLMEGADEEDLVNSGLEDTMITAYQQVRDTWKKNSKIKDMRTAAFVLAINNVASSYTTLGIWP